MSGHESSTTPDRRTFLAATAATATAAAATLCSPSLALGNSVNAPKAIEIIDAHQHLWDLERFRLPWTDGNENLAKNYLIPEYRKAVEGQNVVKSIYMEVGMANELQTAEAEWLIELCNDDGNDTVAGVIAGNPLADTFEAYVRRFAKEDCIKGLRHLLQIPESPKGMCLGKDFQKGVQLLGELGLRFDICIRAPEIEDGVELVKACPNTRFVLDHCGNADPAAFSDSPKYDREPQHKVGQWKRAIDSMAQQDNVICKISGIIARVVPNQWSADDLAPIVNHCLDCFGPDRVIFASDWPVCTEGAPLSKWIGALKEIVASRPEAEQRKLFSETAVKFYELD